MTTGPTVLLFGASGLLGRRVHAALGVDLWVCAPARAGCDLAAADPVALADLLATVRPDVVVNCAGRTDGGGTDLLRIHVLALARLIEAMATTVPGARLIRLGSAAEYGIVASATPVAEDHPARPVSAYGLSHLTATQLGELAGREAGVEVVTLRVFNPVGPGLSPQSVLGRAAALLRVGDGAPLEIGLTDSVRDFVDLRDIASAVRAAVLAGALPVRLFNVGSGHAVDVRDAVVALARIAGHSGELRPGAFTATAGRSAAVPWMCADTSRIRQVLGWSPSYDLADSLKALWVDHQDAGPHSRR
ncbi:NAD-dependent epimerase/dehydratase family protein [Solwaraspora sp. WMMA2101]|uniref:NAD-dependent epimerase/dehydratase family protein n=1 Tax=Solwaraspora sp. WMMA2101 TaxID=3404124 RepID=UPI003B946224